MDQRNELLKVPTAARQSTLQVHAKMLATRLMVAGVPRAGTVGVVLAAAAVVVMDEIQKGKWHS
jgi:hypothetical protein